MLRLFAFYSARGHSLEALANTTSAERGFLMGARELYYEELCLIIQAAVARAFSEGDKGGG